MAEITCGCLYKGCINIRLWHLWVQLSYCWVRFHKEAAKGRGCARSWCSSAVCWHENTEGYLGLPSIPLWILHLQSWRLSRLGILFSVSEVNLQFFCSPFLHFLWHLCHDILIGHPSVFGVLKCQESVRKLPCLLRPLQSQAVWLKRAVSPQNPLP